MNFLRTRLFFVNMYYDPYLRRSAAYMAVLCCMGGGLWVGMERWRYLRSIPNRPSDFGPQVFGTQIWEGLIAGCWITLAVMWVLGFGVLLWRMLVADYIRQR